MTIWVTPPVKAEGHLKNNQANQNGNSTKALPDSCCNCAPDEKCSDCGTVYFFSAVNNLKTAIRKSPLIERIRDSLVLALENLFQ